MQKLVDTQLDERWPQVETAGPNTVKSLTYDDFYLKLSDFGLAKLAPVGDKTDISTRVMGTYGYCALEYAKSGKLTLMYDVYSAGVVLLELMSGRSVDHRRPLGKRNLVVWVGIIHAGSVTVFEHFLE